jgi:hypothetical protein
MKSRLSQNMAVRATVLIIGVIYLSRLHRHAGSGYHHKRSWRTGLLQSGIVLNLCL